MKTNIHAEPELWACAAATGGLDETEQKAWNDHAATCPACQKRYEEELAMGMLMKQALNAESPDPGFERRMIRKFRQKYTDKAGRRSDFFSLPLIRIGAVACLALIAIAAIGWLTRAKTSSPTVAANVATGIDSLPEAVRQTVRTQADGLTVGDIQRLDEHGDISYEIMTTASNGAQRDFTVAQDGTLLTVETALSELPADVQAAITTAVGAGKLEGIDKVFDDGDVTYNADITTDGRERTYTFEQDGTLSSMEMGLADLPAAIQTAVTATVGRGRLEGIDKVFNDVGITYEATMLTPDGSERNFTLSSEGQLLSGEVGLTEAPAAVRQTITQILGNGKLEEVDKSFVAVDNVMPYEIEAKKNGKVFDFLVDPSGRFLGMEN